MKSNWLVWLMLVVVVMLGACSESGGEAVSVLSAEEASEIFENAMQGFEDADYTVWSRDWTDEMKTGIPEEAFLAYREQVVEQYGNLVSVDQAEISPGAKAGYVRWSAIATFETGQIRFTFSFKDDGRLIEGVFPEEIG